MAVTSDDNRAPEITVDNDNYRDQEKHVPVNDDAIKEAPYDTDNSSEHKQEGVKGVEAVTRVWSKKLLWTTFVLYVETSPFPPGLR